MALEKHLDEMTAHAAIDFARLGSKLQQSLIDSVTREESVRTALLAANPALATWMLGRGDADSAAVVEPNADVVRDNYSLLSSGGRLHQIYQAVWNSPTQVEVSGLPQGKMILDSFLDLRRLHPIRLESCRNTNRPSGG